MLNYVLEGIILGVSFLVIFVISERVRIATGKEMLIDKLLAYLEIVYQRTAPNDHKEIDLRGCDLPDKVKIIYFDDKKARTNNFSKGED